MIRLLPLILAILLTSTNSIAQTTFQKTYGGSDDDYINCVRQTTDGGYIIAGETKSFGTGGDDAWIIRTNSTGDTLWTKTYGTTDADDAEYVQELQNSDFIITGTIRNAAIGNNDLHILKISSTGAILWSKVYGGTDSDAGYMVKPTSDGGYVAVGYTRSFGAGLADFLLVKVDDLGNLQWAKAYGGSNEERGYSVEQTADGGYIVAGWTDSNGAGSRDIYVVKTNANGDISWTKTYGGTSIDEGIKIIKTTDGGYAISGSSRSYGNGSDDFILIKTVSDGTLSWAKTYGTADDEFSESLIQMADGGFALIGGTDYNSNANILAVRTNSTGDTLWSNSYGSTFPEADWTFIDNTSDGGIVASAHTTLNFASTNVDGYVIKADANGTTGCFETSIPIIVTTITPTVGSGGTSASGGSQASTSIIVTQTQTIDSTLCLTVGIREKTFFSNYTIYPNPTTGTFTVTGATGVIDVYDLFGRLVLTSTTPQLNMSAFPKGVYFVKVGDAVRKLVKQ